MSEYFQVLNRLREEQGATPRLRAVPRLAPAPVAPRRERVVRREPLPEPAPQPRAPQAFAPAPMVAPAVFQELIDTIERIRSAGGSRCLVLAAATGCEDVDALVQQVARVLGERNMPLSTARLHEGGHSVVESASDLEIAVDGSTTVVCLADWRAAQPQDAVTLLVGPPLAQSRAAAVAARGCDGLALVVELGRTQRQALALSVKRAREAGCTLLGLIVVGSEGLPSWAQRLRNSFL